MTMMVAAEEEVSAAAAVLKAEAARVARWNKALDAAR